MYSSLKSKTLSYFICDRCNKYFMRSQDFVQHTTKQNVPCDFYCNKCGVKQLNKSAYVRHAKKTCKPTLRDVIEHTNSDVEENGTSLKLVAANVNSIDTNCMRVNNMSNSIDTASRDINGIGIDNTFDMNKGNTFNIYIHSFASDKRNIQKKETLTKDLEYVYLLWTRECKRLNEPTYKIGRTSDPVFVRMEGYDKNSELILCLPVKDGISTENYLKKLFKEKYTQKLEYGYEYFYGDHEDMCKDMILAVANELQ